MRNILEEELNDFILINDDGSEMIVIDMPLNKEISYNEQNEQFEIPKTLCTKCNTKEIINKQNNLCIDCVNKCKLCKVPLEFQYDGQIFCHLCKCIEPQCENYHELISVACTEHSCKNCKFNLVFCHQGVYFDYCCLCKCKILSCGNIKYKESYFCCGHSQ